MLRCLSFALVTFGACSSGLHPAGSKPDGSAPADANADSENVLGPESGDDGAAQGMEPLEVVDSDGAFAITPESIRRTGNEPGQSSNRHYVRSVRADFAASDWVS